MSKEITLSEFTDTMSQKIKALPSEERRYVTRSLMSFDHTSGVQRPPERVLKKLRMVGLAYKRPDGEDELTHIGRCVLRNHRNDEPELLKSASPTTERGQFLRLIVAAVKDDAEFMIDKELDSAIKEAAKVVIKEHPQYRYVAGYVNTTKGRATKFRNDVRKNWPLYHGVPPAFLQE